MDTKEFIRKARELNGNRYDYSLVDYIKSNIKVKIVCPVHGVFEQTPANHLSGHQCPACSGRKKLTKEDFIRRSREVHGDRYDYSQVEFNGLGSKVKIICPVHGVFEQYASSHVNGHGCSKCAGKESIGKEEFVRRAEEKFGKTYDYSESEYVNMRTPLVVICPEHGRFMITPFAHLQGKGCPECKKEGIGYYGKNKKRMR